MRFDGRSVKTGLMGVVEYSLELLNTLPDYWILWKDRE